MVRKLTTAHNRRRATKEYSAITTLYSALLKAQDAAGYRPAGGRMNARSAHPWPFLPALGIVAEF